VTVAQLFDDVSARLLERDPALGQGRMMNAVGLKTGGRFFAFVVDGALVVKLPAERVSELVASGEGRPFESGRRVMKEWVSLEPASEESCAAHVLAARDFVAALVAS
jgi:hypothetical protein